MATRSTKSGLAKKNIVFSLAGTRLKKLSVESKPPSEKLKKGKVNISFKIGVNEADNGESVLVNLEISGGGLDNEGDDEGDMYFSFDAAIDGIYKLSRKAEKSELIGIEGQLANPLIPLLSDMIETLLNKCGYSGIVLAKSFPNSDDIKRIE